MGGWFPSSVIVAPAPVPAASPCPATNQLNALQACGWPNSLNTGYIPTGVSLTTYTGSTTIAPNTTLDSFHFTSSLTVGANVRFTRCWFDLPQTTNCRDFFAPDCPCTSLTCAGCTPHDWVVLSGVGTGANGLFFTDCEFSGGYGGINGDNTSGDITILRCNFHNSGENFVTLPSGTISCTDSYFHDYNNDCHTGGHCQIFRSQTIPTVGLTLRHNTMNGKPTDAANGGQSLCFMKPDFGTGTLGNVTVDNCLLAGTVNTYVQVIGAGLIGTVHVTNNRVGRDFGQSYFDLRDGTITVSGNVFDNDGTPAP